MVNSLKLENGDWDDEKLDRLFDQESVKNIKEMFWAKEDQDDRLIWTKTKSGMFSVKSAYKVEEETKSRFENWWRILWKSPLHERTKLFLWKLANSGLPVASNLVNRGVAVDNSNCFHGCQHTESESHLFFLCEVAKRVWFASPWGVSWEQTGCIDLISFLNCIINPIGRIPIGAEDQELFFVFSAHILEHLWWFRNQAIHEGNRMNVELSIVTIRNRTNELFEAWKRERLTLDDQE
nr:uncharacterized protein LOC125424342 [Ziziphus jujuba var. spinosa]